ncbi:NERD domain-containing protein [Neobacillus terrae]|uniref:NERD domain-containing protein n=1 Tax=Neobacillus terrae TaxID=3034837 RepID=UPI00140C2842|nr:NERD domain-containing protein [Neobacillus terrae]NHM30659.1 NERD domain-containing protein [Neobacillus terrae]
MWVIILILFLACSLILKNPKVKGLIGEKHVSNILNKLDPQENILLNDLYIPKENGQTTQIDHLLISNKGLFVIEMKNYSGWILGSEKSQNWTQLIYKRKEKFYNPIWQNSTHIKALENYLGDTLAGVPIYSIIVFGKNATLKFKEPFSKAQVIKSNQLLNVINSTSIAAPLPHFKMKKIQSQLSMLVLKESKARKERAKEHVHNIKREMAARNTMISNDICPRCGGKLVMRKGKNGQFHGCSNYPKCRFTA